MHGDERRQLVRDFLARHKLGAISTVNPDGSPEAAVIQVTLGEDLNIVFDSFPGSRKLANIERDSRIAMVIGWGTKTSPFKLKAGPGLPRLTKNSG